MVEIKVSDDREKTTVKASGTFNNIVSELILGVVLCIKNIIQETGADKKNTATLVARTLLEVVDNDEVTR